jgi:hypothetical protein
MELDIERVCGGQPMMGLAPVLQALGSRPTLTKLRLRHCFVKGTEARPPDSTVTLEACRVLFFSEERRVGGTCTSVVS